MKYHVWILILLMLLMCACQKQTEQANASTFETSEAEFIEEPEPIQEILTQNANLMAQNQQLTEELQRLKNAATLVTIPEEPQPAVSPQTAIAAAVVFTPDAPANAWQYVQSIAARSMVDGEAKTTFLQTASKLIKEWEESQNAIAGQQESIRYLEIQAQDDPDAIGKLAEAKQKLTELQAVSLQAQRDLDTLIAPYRKLQPQAVITPEPQYGNLSVLPSITITEFGEFVVTIRYNKDDAVLSDSFNLSTGQGESEQQYPPALCRSIYRQIGRMRRADMVTWSRAVTMQEKIDFTNVITNMPRTLTANGY